jgi:type I restriction enzyme S subunit
MVGKICDSAKFKYGYTESALNNPQLPKYLRVTDINKNSYIDWDTVPNCPIDDNQLEKYALKKNDIVIARMADPGKVAIIEEDIKGIFASYLIKIEYDRKKVTPYFLFYTLRSPYYLGLFSGANSGSTRGSINAKAIGGTYFIYPPIGTLRFFDKKVSVLRNQIIQLNRMNINLKLTRDMLLPRLISGKISVENLDIQFPPSMQTREAT